MTNSEVIETEIGMTFENCETNILGSCKKIIISKDDTIIIDGDGDKEGINERV